MALVVPAAETDVVLHAWDLKGRPSPRATTGRRGAAAMILVVELNERLTTLGIAVNLVTYLTGTMHLGNAEAANAVTNFMGTSFMLCLLGGFLADSFLGRYLTIAISAAVQSLVSDQSRAPLISFTFIRPPPSARASGGQLGVLYLALGLTALGTGGLKSCVSPFGLDQFDEADDGEKHQMARFIGCFFFFVSLGSLPAVTVVVYIQDHLGRQWGYGICAVATAAGLAIFLAGTRRYRFSKLTGSPLTRIAAVGVAAWRKRHLQLPADPSMLYEIHAAAGEPQRVQHTDYCTFLDHAAIYHRRGPSGGSEASKWKLATVTDVEEVKTMLLMLPIWATTIAFWIVVAQMTTFSVTQATTMNRLIGPSSFQIPAASLNAILVGSIMLVVPVYDHVVVPVARRFSGNPHGLTPLQRIGVAQALAVVAMVAAALTEAARLRRARAVVPVSVFWLTPQFFLVAFAYSGQMEFFLRECPKSMETLSTGLFLSTLSLGFFLSSALVKAVHKATGGGHHRPWIADDLNKGRLDNFYWLVAVICLLNLLAYFATARSYTYKASRAGAGASRWSTTRAWRYPDEAVRHTRHG
ncbi:hypothetical protein U9M48_041119 [Paspalum notatum var. saurae]|uniref:Uncharacterized protein n=1 Tax=Paspalum notatum var. saurae TaxID=547442 RepID=A0AAQ3XDV4_PASNO